MPDVKELIAQKGVEALEELQTYVKAGKDFVVEQSPLLIQEIIRWGFYNNLCWFLLNLTLFTLCWITVYQFFFSKWGKEVWKDVSSSSGPTDKQAVSLAFSIPGAIGGIIFLLPVCIYLHEII